VDTQKYRALADLDFVPPQCPPPDAKIPPLSDEDKRTLVRWIDLGCPIDLDFDAANPQTAGHGWMLDDNRPILTVTAPQPGANAPITRLLIGMHDYYTGLDFKTFSVVADFPIDGIPAGRNLAAEFEKKTQGVWELRLDTPITELPRGTVVVSVRDRQGNMARLERTFAVAKTSR
jgi:hypothetical protein